MHTVPEKDDGQRLDRYLKSLFPNTPFTAVQKLIRSGQVRVDGKRAKADQRLLTGQVLRLPPSLTEARSDSAPTTNHQPSTSFQATKADLAELKDMIVYEDDKLLALNKPAGLASQAGPNITKSLDRLLAAAYEDAPKLTHRLDRETTGVILAAKGRMAAAHVAEQFREQTAPHKIYLALLHGHLVPTSKAVRGWHHIKAPLGKSRGQGGARSFVDEAAGAAAHTSYQILTQTTSAHGPVTLVAARPHTGRMNQLRVHFAHLGHPLVGDDKYGNPSQKTSPKTPLHLHAAVLVVTHPKLLTNCTLTAPLPVLYSAFLPADFPKNLLDLPAYLG